MNILRRPDSARLRCRPRQYDLYNRRPPPCRTPPGSPDLCPQLLTRATTLIAMRVGIVILQEHRWAEAADKWRRAEQYGFAHAWVYDHVGWRDLVDGPWFDAVPTLTAAATVTSRIRLGTCVASPTFRHPVSFARQITALDDISSGRFILGVGAGTGVPSFDAQVLGSEPLTPGQRIDRLGEFVQMLDPILRDIPT